MSLNSVERNKRYRTVQPDGLGRKWSPSTGPHFAKERGAAIFCPPLL